MRGPAPALAVDTLTCVLAGTLLRPLPLLACMMSSQQELGRKCGIEKVPSRSKLSLRQRLTIRW
jgi:hypothetical protein